MSQAGLITDNREVFALLNLFKEIASEQGWQPGNWLEASPETASYLSVMHEGRLAGGVQIVFPDEQAYLPYQSVCPEATVCNPTKTAYVTILALAKKFRGKQGIFWSLCIELWRLCVARGVETVILEATPTMLEKYRKLRWLLESRSFSRLRSKKRASAKQCVEKVFSGYNSLILKEENRHD